jgi:6-phosphogluconolactonase
MQAMLAPNGASVTILETPSALAEAFAEELVASIRRRLGKAPFFALALTGGRTPAPLYRKLLDPAYADAVDWSRVKVFFGDERAVPPGHLDSNYGMARGAWLGAGRVPKENVFRMEGEDAGEAGDWAEAARRYEAVLRREVPAGLDGVPALDLALLGMGDDGHVASLFPGTDALEETRALVVANVVPRLRTTRLTVTWPILAAAREVWLLVTGANKAERVVEALGWRPGGERLPAWRVRPLGGQARCWLDAAAAGLIPR